MTFLSRTAYAKSKGWSRQYVGKLAQNGRLIETADGLVDVDATEQFLGITSDPSRRPASTSAQNSPISHVIEPVNPPEPPSMVVGYQQSKARLALAQARLAETTLLETNKSLVDVAVVDAAAFAAGRMLRDLILSLPTQIAPELSGMSDPWEIEKYLVASLRRVLDDAASMTAADFDNAIHS
ncbi:hypothetical protein [Pseudomonas syringae]|uniref:hypothetical protein n=1 Tax=Pseudomonas syringae TaxID=317 RepID=UPI001BD081A2|nr:hypothetical protein [Pseudomonas syringae]QVK34057.1 hypothetical protein KIJ28_09035 [Pseudomonas syringae]